MLILSLHLFIPDIFTIHIKNKTMPKKKPQKGNPEVHDDLKGFDIKINEFGEITSNVKVEKLNEFLDENVEDKKLVDREDLAQNADIQEEE